MAKPNFKNRTLWTGDNLHVIPPAGRVLRGMQGVLPNPQPGGTDHLDNLQLLCCACNSTKGAGTQEELLVALKRDGVR